ncbi:uncharacterized protein T551_03749 [Pneumocystis jirovecii RU7]|uniref:Major surface glycoprotein 2 C-terminal domain-containing protein n=1 Tax=Pneumocystis jirovecii (strain RU7) TaxID=1408657 RepID=A0A0W4ZAG3_PNEJ7|nr:uncharacterized protein T551_03749 [Pneumocystis jirovecii RU7]KTW25451.1 hypothetical protein T551_03749 [Pneumocystis jirovecii RU7]
MARAVARAVKRQAQKNDEIGEEHLLALILKEGELDQQECKKRLKEYCKNLRSINPKLDKVDQKLQKVCKEDRTAEEKCTGLKDKVTQKCNDFKNKLQIAAVKEISKLTDGDCKENERQCLFLEGACPTKLKDNCNTLRNKCYQKKRDKVAEDALLRAVRGSLTSEVTCQGRLKEVCIELSQESDELTKLCLYQETTCSKFVSGKKGKCDTLEKDVKAVLEKKNELRGKCLPLLEQCYFHRGNCEGDKSKCNEPTNQGCKEYIPDCDKLEEECEKQNIIYIHPGPDFDPTKPEPTVAEDIGLEELYKEAEKDGIFIGKNHLRDATALLALLNKNLEKQECIKTLQKSCKNPHEHEALEKLCKDNTLSDYGKEKCEELKNDVNKTCKILTSKVIDNRLFDPVNSKVVGWGKLPTFLSDEECARLESYCFYFKERCPDVKEACMNVRAACYKRGLDARANDVLQENMRGLLRGSNKTWLKDFQQKLIKVCEELKEGNKGSFPNDEIFVLCVQPAKAARLLTHDHQMRVIFLRQQLDQKRDFPTDKDCKELGRKCEALGKDSNQSQWPCHTLKQQCDRLGTTEILKQVLLDEHKDTLKTHENCVTYLKEKCNKWSRRGDDRFSFVCVFQNATCELMVKDVKDRCEVFKKNIEVAEIVDFLKNNTNNITTLERNCPSWHTYCNRFSPNCPDLTKEDSCTKVKKHCEPFYKRKALEDALKVELRGNLNKNKCESALKGYCTQLGKLNNESIRSLCKDNTKNNLKKNDEDVRKELCEKLVKEVEEQCKALPTELEQPTKELEEDSKTYEELKKQAKDSMNKSNLVLSFVKKNGSNTSKNNSKSKDKNAVSNGLQDTTEHVKILRRGVKDVSVTESEAKAFDLAAEVFGRYVDLKEKCEKLTSDCGIKKDCKALENVCEKIQGVCSKLKPLKVKPHEIVTESTTTTTTTTTTVTNPKATECKSLQTTDTWVTQTSTHTSTSTITSTITSKITLTSTRRCKPTKCTTGDDAEDVKPSEGLRVSGWNVMRGVIVAMVISFMI